LLPGPARALRLLPEDIRIQERVAELAHQGVLLHKGAEVRELGGARLRAAPIVKSLPRSSRDNDAVGQDFLVPARCSNTATALAPLRSACASPHEQRDDGDEHGDQPEQRRVPGNSCRRPATGIGQAGHGPEVEGVRQVVGGGVARAERGQPPAILDELQHRGRVVLGMINVPAPGVGRDDDRRDARPRPPLIALRRRDMVPAPAILVVGDDDRDVGPVGAVLDRANQVRDVLLSLDERGVAGVLVVRPERLDEGDRRQRPVAEGSGELLLILQVGRLRRRAVRVVGEVGERLVVVLEERVRFPGERIVPAAGIPGPADILLAQAIADGRHRLVRDEIGRIGDRRRVGRIDRVRGVHHVAVGRHRPVLHQPTVGVELGDGGGRSVGPLRRAGADQPEVVEERAAEGGVEEVVRHRVLLGELALRHVRGVEVAHS
jgi:hypothetical protein